MKWWRLALLVPAVGMTACQSSPPVEVSEVLNHGMCKTLRTGLTVVNYERLAAIRGARLLNAPEESSPTDDISPNAGTLLAVSNGSQPTPGYAFELRGARAEGNQILLD